MKRLIFVLLLSLSIPAVSYPEKINWVRVEKTMFENNPSVKTAKNNLLIAKYSYLKSLGAFLPVVSIGASASQSDNDRLLDGSRAFGQNLTTSYSYNLNASYAVFSGFADYYLARQASSELDAAQAAYDRALSDALYNAAVEYINLMWSYERVDLLENIENKRIENWDMIRLKYNSGNVDLGSLMRVEADAETIKSDLQKARRYIETVSAALCAEMGIFFDDILETDERIYPQDEIPSLPPKTNFNEHIEKIPEFLTAKYRLESALYQSRASKSPFLPHINASASLNQNNPEKPQSQDALNSWSASLSVSYALFNGGRDFLSAKTASKNFASAQENFKSISVKLKARIISEYNALIDVYETIRTRRLYMHASRLQAEISDRKYINGLSSYQDWYSISNDYINSQIQFLETKRAAALQEIRWFNFLGKNPPPPGKKR